MTPTDARVFTLPDLGEGLQEAEIVRWRVEVGDTVGVDTVVVEVETAKATVEIPCPYAGEVRERSAQTGDVVRVGQSLLSVCPDPAGASAAGGNGREAHRSEEQAGSGNVLVGFGTGVGEPGRRSRRSLRAEPERDRKSTRLNSSHVASSYAVFCLKKTKESTMRWSPYPLSSITRSYGPLLKRGSSAWSRSRSPPTSERPKRSVGPSTVDAFWSRAD